jgi:putative heme-binding domain-containing protein
VASLPLPAVARLQEIYRDDGAALQGPIFAISVKPFNTAEFLEFARANAGDSGRGRILFEDSRGMGCLKCHRVRGQGGEVGPDLSEVGDQFDRGQLAEHVLLPSKSIREGYQQVTVILNSGKTQSGLVSSESTDSLVLRDAEGKLHTLLKSQIDERQGSAVSLMPERLVEGISLEEFSDLVSFLQSLRRRPAGSPNPLQGHGP